MIDFHAIRPHQGDKRKGFEELVVQLARQEKPSEREEYRRVEGAGGDGGVEAYWILNDKTEQGYQAKYFLSTKDIDWGQIDESVKTALDKHPKLTKYTIALACDLTDRSGKLEKGKTGWGHWETHKAKWIGWANSRKMSVDFIPWTQSNLIDKLVSDTSNRGVILWWFNVNIFNDQWFKEIFSRAKADLGERFQPEDHVEVGLAKAFEGLARSSAYLDYLSNWFKNIPPQSAIYHSLEIFDLPVGSMLEEDFRFQFSRLKEIGTTVHSYDFEPLPLNAWGNSIKNAFDALLKMKDWLRAQDARENESLKNEKERGLDCLDSIGSYLDHTPIHLNNGQHEIKVECDLLRAMVVVGEAGSGKSHLFADRVKTFLENGTSAILVLGQYFPGNDLRREFLNCLDLATHDFSEVLQALNAAGEAANTRLVILIDALNEAENLRVWPNQLSSFLSEILQYEWLAICVSLRPEYEAHLIPSDLQGKVVRANCRGITTAHEQEQAAVQFLEKRNIVRPSLPWLAPEFSNFLFLKTCCDALQEKGIREFPKGLHGSYQVIVFFLDKVDSKLRKSFPGTLIPSSAVQNSILNIAKSMANTKKNYILLEAASGICEIEFNSRGPNAQNSWFSILVEEGVFRKDHSFSIDRPDPFECIDEVFRFTYQRFSDHLIVQALLKDVVDIDSAFDTDGLLGFLLDQNSFLSWLSIWNALAVQIPEKFNGKEILDIVSCDIQATRIHYTLPQAFEQSLLWRSNDAFSERTLELFNALNSSSWSDTRFDILIRLAVRRDHPWNAAFLSKNLRNRPMPQRDAFWTVPINHASKDDTHPVWELIRWCHPSSLVQAEVETLRLTAITLIWMFTSSNRELRDKATKALIPILVIRPEFIPEFLSSFAQVDDLYVMERICSAVLGAITREIGPAYIQAAANGIYQAIFHDEKPPLNVNLRDYAWAVIEYAFFMGCLSDEIDMKKCRPPYKSQWPLTEVTEEEVEQIAKESGGDEILFSALKWGDFGRYEIEPLMRHFSNVSLTQSPPLNNEQRKQAFLQELASWESAKQGAFAQLELAVEEKKASMKINSGKNGIPTISYSPEKIEHLKKCQATLYSLLSKAEQRTFEDLIDPELLPNQVTWGNRDLPEFDSNFAKRWITKRAYNYGWDKKLFPGDRSLQRHTSGSPRVERIGKKYQWLALHEFLARLSDNVWTIGGWPTRAKKYDHPAEGWFVRDIEPSFLFDLNLLNSDNDRWPKKLLKLEPISDELLADWPFKGEPPNTSAWLGVISPSDGISWLLMYGFSSVDEDREKKESVGFFSFRRNTFVRVSTILVKKQEVDAVVSELNHRQLSDPSGHELVNWTDGPFLCEFPWRNTWHRESGIYEEGNIGKSSYFKYIRPIERHKWESNSDSSLLKGSTICIPKPWMCEKLRLRPNLDRIGEFVSKNNGETIFLDPTVGGSSHSVALMHKNRFLEFLKKENLECLWIIAGERNSWPSGMREDYSCRRFSSLYRWRDDKWEGERWYEDTSGRPSG